MDIVKYNSGAWDAEVERGSEWARPVSAGEIERARDGDFSIILTPTKPVPKEWFPPDLQGLEILCLASGGGQQAPILAAAGANVTSFDNSNKQLELDGLVAKREGLDIRLEQGDAANLSRFDDQTFDLIWHPCSNGFMPNLEPVWNETYRVLKKGGTLLSGFINPILFIFDREKDEKEKVLEVRYSLPFSDLEDLDKDHLEKYKANNEPLEYGHTLEQQIGGQINAGFVIDRFFEDYWSDEATTLNKYTPTSIATRARKL